MININEESAKEIKEFRKKQIEINIKLHIIFFFILLIINIGLLFFIILYKSKISEIKSKTKKDSSSISIDKESIIQSNYQIEHKLVNILANGLGGYYRFSMIFENHKQIQTVKNYIIDYFKGKYESLQKMNMSHLEVIFKYQSAREGDNFYDLKDRIEYSYHTLFIIETESEMKFGFFIEEVLIIEDNKYSNNDINCFIFSFQKEGIFNCIGQNKKIEIDKNNDDGMLIIGNGDIIIKHNFLQNESGGVINYPFKSFDISTINNNIFTGINGEFKIRYIEIYSFDVLYIEQ